MNITIGSTTTTDRLDIVYILFNSIKQTKRNDTYVTYHLFVKYTEQCNREYCQNYFSKLQSPDFNIKLEDVDVFKDAVHTPARDHIYYAKCLFPKYFSSKDRVLFLDVDLVFIKQGIEELWNSNIDDYYVGAVIDPTWTYSPLLKAELSNTGSDNYFNAGVILFNNKKIREDKKDDQLADWCIHWDTSKLKCYCYDQTLINHILKDKVKLLDFKFNNSLLASGEISRDVYSCYLSTKGYKDQFKSLEDAVLLHFSGPNKPWDENVVKYSSDYLYKELALQIWAQIVKVFGEKHD